MPTLYNNRLLFAANHFGQLIAMYAQGEFAEPELGDYNSEHDWGNELPEPPCSGLWVWEFDPVGGGPDYWGEYDAPEIDHGIWRELTSYETHCALNGDNPWTPMSKYSRPFEENILV